jgi:NADH-quinone oxidoreductase subunit F
MPALAFLRKFRKEFEAYVTTRGKSSTGLLAPERDLQGSLAPR